MKKITLLLAALLAGAWGQQTPPSPRPHDVRAAALVGGTLLDVGGRTLVQNSVILINRGRIERVGTQDSLPVPAGYTQITSARDPMAPTDAVLHVKERIPRGDIPGPTMYVSGALLEHQGPPGFESFRRGVSGVADARAKVNELGDKHVDLIKLLCVPEMTDADRWRAVQLRPYADQRGDPGRPCMAARSSTRHRRRRPHLDDGVQDNPAVAGASRSRGVESEVQPDQATRRADARRHRQRFTGTFSSAVGVAGDRRVDFLRDPVLVIKHGIQYK